MIYFSILDEFDRRVKLAQPPIKNAATMRRRLTEIEFKTPRRFRKTVLLYYDMR